MLQVGFDPVAYSCYLDPDFFQFSVLLSKFLVGLAHFMAKDGWLFPHLCPVGWGRGHGRERERGVSFSSSIFKKEFSVRLEQHSSRAHSWYNNCSNRVEIILVIILANQSPLLKLKMMLNPVRPMVTYMEK